jgi:hypothetical protein
MDLNYWPESLSFIIEGLLLEEPSTRSTSRIMDSGHVKTQAASSANMYQKSFTLSGKEHHELMNFYRHNEGRPFFWQDGQLNGRRVLCFGGQPIIEQEHHRYAGPNESHEYVAKITVIALPNPFDE